MVDGIGTQSPTHEIDEYKSRVAVEVEWNNQDPYLELFARSTRSGWTVWGDEAETYQAPDTLYSRQSEEVGWRLFEKPEASSPDVDSPAAL